MPHARLFDRNDFAESRSDVENRILTPLRKKIELGATVQNGESSATHVKNVDDDPELMECVLAFVVIRKPR